MSPIENRLFLYFEKFGGKEMNIYVLMKRTFDTEEKIVLSNGKVNEEDAEFIINPYDEYAIEEALQIRETVGGTITVISVGHEQVSTQIRTALAMGADKGVLIQLEGDGDQYTTAKIIAAYLKDKDIDIILAGNVAIDGGSGQVGPRVAELLGINYVTTITEIKIEGTSVKVNRDVEGDSEVIETNLPLLVTAQQGLNEPRYPSLPGIMKAKKKPLEILDQEDLGLHSADMEAKTEILDIFLPPEKEAGQILTGELDEQVKELVQLLHNKSKVF